nr:hypothetical protein [Ruminococcus sp. AF46-10NS]
MEFNHGVLFSDTYQKKLKSQFYYADKDPQYGARLFFENSGGSLRLKKLLRLRLLSRSFRIVRSVPAAEVLIWQIMLRMVLRRSLRLFLVQRVVLLSLS